MYEEQIKELRALDIKYKSSVPYEVLDALSEAADAIEELSRVVDAIPRVCECCIGCEVETGGCDRGFVLSPKRAREYLNRLRWIPVTKAPALKVGDEGYPGTAYTREPEQEPEPFRARWDVKKGLLHPLEIDGVCTSCGFITGFYCQYKHCPQCGALMEE